MVMEIPLAYPPLLDPNEQPTVFVVNDVLGTIREKNTATTTSTGNITASRNNFGVVSSALNHTHFSLYGSGNHHHSAYDRGAVSTSWMTLAVHPTLPTPMTTLSNNYTDNEKDYVMVTDDDDDHNGASRHCTYLVTTSPIVTTACQTIAVCLFDSNESSTSSRNVKMIHLDLGTEARYFQTIAKVQAFATRTTSTTSTDTTTNNSEYNNDNHYDAIQVTMIDTNGFVISVVLSATDMVPISTQLLHCYSIGTTVLNNTHNNNKMRSGNTYNISTYSIRSSMILFISKSMVLLSLNPFLIAIHLNKQIAVQWSKTICIDEMKLRNQRRKTIVGTFVNLLAGATGISTNSSSSDNKQQHIVDMNPVSALVSADNDPTQIFSLHSDGTIRRWVLQQHQLTSSMNDDDSDNTMLMMMMKPYEVYDLQIYPRSNRTIVPSPERWSDDVNSIQMSARTYDANQLFVLAISIQTMPTAVTMENNNTIRSANPVILSGMSGAYEQDIDETSVAATESTEYEIFDANANMNQLGKRNRNQLKSDCNILVLDGRVESTTDDDELADGGTSSGGHTAITGGGVTSNKNVHCIALNIPSNASNLIDIKFDCQQDRCVLQALFGTKQSSTVLVTYPSSNISIVYREPQPFLLQHQQQRGTGKGNSNDKEYDLFTKTRFCYLDDIAKEELDRIRQLSFYKNFALDDEEEEDDDDDDQGDEGDHNTITQKEKEQKLEEVLHSIDCCYLQYLFRPTFPRGVGGLILPPSLHHIRYVVRLFRQRHGITATSTAATTTNTNSSMELQVVRTIHEIRKANVRRVKLQQQQSLIRTIHRSNVTTTSTSSSTGAVHFTEMTTPRKGVATSTATLPGTTPGGSTFVAIYEDIRTADGNNDNINDDDVVFTDNADRPASTRIESTTTIEYECKAHESRWRQLLLAIWEEEDRERRSLAITIPPKNSLLVEDSIVIVRPSCVSVVHTEQSSMDEGTNTSASRPTTINQQATTPLLTALDRLASKIMQYMEHHEPDASILKSAEKYVWDVICRGQIAIDPTSSIGTMEDKLRYCTTDSALSLFDNDDDCKRDVRYLEKNVSEDELLQQLLFHPIMCGSSVPGLDLVYSNNYQTIAMGKENNDNEMIDYQTRLLSSSLVVRTLHTLRRLFLGRYLILNDVIGNHSSISQDVLNIALQMYLHTNTVLWTCTQIVPIPKISLTKTTPSFEQKIGPNYENANSMTNSPLSKRIIPSLGLSSILPTNPNSTTVLDARLIQLYHQSGMKKASSVSSLTVSSMELARMTLQKGLQFVCFESAEQSISHEQLPELGILPLNKKGPGSGSSSSSISNEYAKIVIRLIAPFLVFPTTTTVGGGGEGIDHVVAVRHEVMAESLLEASYGEVSTKRSMALILHAFLLLRFDETDLPNAMHHVETLNRHSAKNPKVTFHFLDYVSNAIKQVNNMYNNNINPYYSDESMITDSSIESYLIMLWTVLFNTAITIQNWEIAYDACIHNPDKNERMNNSRRYIIAMVDAGALTALQNKCCPVMVSSNSSSRDTTTTTSVTMNPFPRLGDLYGIAVHELTELSKRDIYTRLAAAMVEESSTTDDGSIPLLLPSTDYNAALYSLLSSKHDWKRAAQALDLRYVNAIECLSKDDTLDGSNSMDITKDYRMTRRDKCIINDLVMSAVGCYNTMLNVTDIDDQFLVTGESQPVPSVPISIGSRSSMYNNKRGRGHDNRTIINSRSTAAFVGTNNNNMSINRLQRFMTIDDLHVRAVRATVLNVLANDPLCDIQFVKSSFLNPVPDFDSDQMIITKLYELGYYVDGLHLAQVISYQMKTKPNGFSPMYYELFHLVTEYLIPIAINTTPPAPPPQGEEMTGLDSSSRSSRPTLLQLYSVLDRLNTTPFPPPTTAAMGNNNENTVFSSSSSSFLLVTERYKKMSLLEQNEIQITCMKIIHTLVVMYVDSETPIAKDVAESFLFQHSHVPAPVPAWLEHILLHGTATSTTTSAEAEPLPGLFALRPKQNTTYGNTTTTYLGDPSALLNLYIRRGLYCDACRIVCTVLNRENTSSTAIKQVSSRLPEKGEIDFVPYHKIDQLWNLIEQQVQQNSNNIDNNKRVDDYKQDDDDNDNNDDDDIKMLLHARKQLEVSLEHHYRMVQINQHGIKSARALLRSVS